MQRLITTLILRNRKQLFNYLLLFMSVGVMVYFLPKNRTFNYDFEQGKPWAHKDISAPFDFAIEKAEAQIQKEIKQRLRNTFPIYKFSPAATDESLRLLAQNIELFNEDIGTQAPKLDFNSAKELFLAIQSKGIIEIKHNIDSSERLSIVNLVKNNISEKTYLNSFYSLADAQKQAVLALQNKPFAERDALKKIFSNSFVTNIIYDKAASQNEIIAIQNNMVAYNGVMLKGQLIIEKGQFIDPQKFQILTSLKNEYENRLSLTTNNGVIALGQFIILTIIMVLLMVFLSLFRKDIFAESRRILLILIVITTMMVALAWALKLNLPNVYFVPYCMVPIIIRVLFDTRLAFYIHILVVLVAAFFVPNGLEFTFLQATAGMAAIFSIKNLLRRSQFLVSAAIIFLVYISGYMGIMVMREGIISLPPTEIIIAFISSVVLSLLAYPGIYLFERSFEITSELTLMELSGANHPLLRELSFKAPGTFQHSLQVANLSEEVILQIGGNALLVRCGALYHDIGKMANPQYFIENLNQSQNPHEAIDYEESAQLIIKHVTHGVELAKIHRLPKDIINFIYTHHGTTKMSYFYNSFLKAEGHKPLDESHFTYPGPIPFTKEQAVLMLSDSVEAASRSLVEPDNENIDELVERIVEFKLDQGQLANSDLTIKDITVTKQIFKKMLKSIYHVRVAYPTI